MLRYIVLFIIVFFQSVLLSAQISFRDVDELREYFRWTEDRTPLVSAHRGGPYPGYPENCLETFDHVLNFTQAIIECDIEITKDSCLVMMHDNTLDRTTTGVGKVNEYTLEEIKETYLKDPEGKVTGYSIPTLEEVLLWTKGKAVLTLDVKRGVPFKKVVDMVMKTGSEAYVVIITYNLQQAIEVYAINPALMLSVSIRNNEEFEQIKNSGIPLENIVAFTGTYLKEQTFYDDLHTYGIFCILGTMGNLDNKAISKGDKNYLELYSSGADILATDRPLEVATVIAK